MFLLDIKSKTFWLLGLFCQKEKKKKKKAEGAREAGRRQNWDS